MSKRVAFSQIVLNLPEGGYKFLRKAIYKSKKRGFAAYCDLRKYASSRITNENIEKYTEVRSITVGYYDYEYLNIGYI